MNTQLLLGRHTLLVVAISVAAGQSSNVVSAQSATRGGPAAVPAVAPAQSEIAALVDRYGVDRMTLLRRYNVEYSPERYARLTKFYKDWQAELAAVPFDTLGVEGRIDAVLLGSRLEYELRLLAREQAWVDDTASLIPFAPSLTTLLEARQRLDPMNPPKIAATLDTVTRDIDAAIKQLEARSTQKGPSTASNGSNGQSSASVPAKTSSIVTDAERARKISAMRAAEILTSVKTSLTEWSRFYSGYDPLFTWWTSNPYAKTDKALAAYIKALREKVVGYKEGDDEPIVGNPVGREALVADLRSEFVPYTPEELLKVAEKEFAWCDQEMLSESVLPRRRADPGVVSDRHDGSRRQDDEHARERHPLLALDSVSRAQPWLSSAAVHDRSLQPAAARVRHAVLDRGLVAVLGNAALGRWVCQNAGESGGHAVPRAARRTGRARRVGDARAR